MSKAIRFALIAPVAALLASILACPTSSTQPSVLLSLSATTVRNDGAPVTVTVTTTDATADAGSGTVTLTVDKGVLGGSGASATLTLASGKGTVDYSCNLATDSTCTGLATFNVTWGAVTGMASVNVRAPASGTDGGTDGGGGGGPQPDAGGSVVSVWSSRISLVLGMNDSANQMATLTDNGTAVSGTSMSVKTNLGRLVGPDGGIQGKAFSFPTDTNGTVAWRLIEDGDAGTATITAAVPTRSAVGTATVDFIAPGGINYIGTTCREDQGVAPCRVLGVYGYNYHETAWVSFEVVDKNGAPVGAGVPVQFDIPTGPAGTMVEPIAYTDASGVATARIQTGRVAGPFHVNAVLVSGAIYTTSASLVVTGVSPSNGGSYVSCEEKNAPVLAMQDPHDMQVLCNVRLVDRLNNTVGVPRTVAIRSEAGAVPGGITTAAVNPDQPDGKEGTGSFYLQTGGLLPIDVAPNTAAGEASRVVSGFTLNPRDGLVTLIAAVRGEEYYNDDNDNGTRDGTEMFIDQSEPFVDNDDDGLWDPGEQYINGTGATAGWDGPSGTWDADTNIWMETHVLYTGLPVPALSHIEPNPYSGLCSAVVAPFPMDINTYVYLYGYFPDANLNRPSGGTEVAIDHLAKDGAVKLLPGSILADLYGFTIQRQLVDAGGGQCTAADPLCTWKTTIDGYPAPGDEGSLLPGIMFEVDAPTSPLAVPCESDTVFVDVTVLDWTVRAIALGAYR